MPTVLILVIAGLPLLCANNGVHDYDDGLDPTRLPDGYHYDDRYDGPGGDFFQEDGFQSVGDDDWGYDSYAYDDERDMTGKKYDAEHQASPQQQRTQIGSHGEQQPSGFDNAFLTALTASTFDLIVRDPMRDVLVAFVAPWCGHCRALAPEFARAADLLAASFPTLVLATFDVTAHQVPTGFDVSGYPTLLFMPAAPGAVQPQRYTGGRQAEDIIDWMKARALSLRRKAPPGEHEQHQPEEA
jgi:protein disulfide-isomerase-like protein